MQRMDVSTHTELSLVVVFADLTRYTAETERNPDREVSRVMDAFYERVAARVEPADGRVIKFIGDAALIVFPETRAEQAIRALLDLKAEIDAFFTEIGWECRINIKAHVGSVIAGPYGGASDKRFDILGKAVNQTARLKGAGVALSAEAFRKLGPELGARFALHEATGTYLPIRHG